MFQTFKSRFFLKLVLFSWGAAVLGITASAWLGGNIWFTLGVVSVTIPLLLATFFHRLIKVYNQLTQAARWAAQGIFDKRVEARTYTELDLFIEFFNGMLCQLQERSEEMASHKRLLEATNEQLTSLAETDGLTGLYNRRAFEKALKLAIQRAHYENSALSLIFLDVDHFKKYNDRWGHPQGDVLLQSLASLLKREVRETDVVARYGGEEFVIILPRASMDRALEVAERVRRKVETFPFEGREEQPLGKVSLSLGISTFPFQATTAEELVQQADQALYKAKRLGRNRIEVY